MQIGYHHFGGGGKIRGSRDGSLGGRFHLQWGPEAKPGRGSGMKFARSWNTLKHTTRKLRPGENERHNLSSLMAFLLQCTPTLCCFSVMLHNVWHLGGHGPLAPPPLNAPLHGPQKKASDFGGNLDRVTLGLWLRLGTYLLKTYFNVFLTPHGRIMCYPAFLTVTILRH